MTEKPEKDADILHTRAHELAQPAYNESALAAAGDELICMAAGGVRYALPLRVVREVARAVTVTALPSAAPQFSGVARIRGRLVAVFDLERLVNRAGGSSPVAAANAAARLVVVCARDDDELGLAVETVSVERAQALKPDSAAEGLFCGVLPSGALLLDASALFDDPRAQASHSLPGIES